MIIDQIKSTTILKPIFLQFATCVLLVFCSFLYNIMQKVRDSILIKKSNLPCHCTNQQAHISMPRVFVLALHSCQSNLAFS